MKKIKLCCFTVNSTHSYIIANNFIDSELENVKVKNIISRFYKKMNDKVFYTEWLNEKIINDYEYERFVFVVNGKEEFISKVNKYLELNESDGYIINCYDIFDIKEDVNNIIQRHDFYINTAGVVRKKVAN